MDAGDLRRAVAEHLGGQIRSPSPVEHSDVGPAEGIRRDVLDAGLVEDRAEPAPDFVGGQRRVVAAVEQQMLGVLMSGRYGSAGR